MFHGSTRGTIRFANSTASSFFRYFANTAKLLLKNPPCCKILSVSSFSIGYAIFHCPAVNLWLIRNGVREWINGPFANRVELVTRITWRPPTCTATYIILIVNFASPFIPAPISCGCLKIPCFILTSFRP